MKLTTGECLYLGDCLGGFFFGLYSGIFAIYLQRHALQESNNLNKAKDILFYVFCVLYFLCMALITIDIGNYFIKNIQVNLLYHIRIIAGTLFACCDFIAQSILIYRCWVVWGYNIHVVIIPSILAFSFFVFWIVASTGPLASAAQGHFFSRDWGDFLLLTSLALSMTVNALATGLIVFRVFKAFREVKEATTDDDQILGDIGRGDTLRRVIFILIESGMVLYSIQLTRFVVTIVTTNAAYLLIGPLHQMFNGITPTIIMVRVSMPLSFYYDEDYLVEANIGSITFAPGGDDPDPIPETENIFEQERRDGIEFSDDSDIQMVER